MNKISIVVPIYNQEKYLKRCLDSLICQTYTNLEIILVNDGSKDLSGQICDEYEKIDYRIIVIHKENGGLSSARNAGIEIASGDYIGFVDSDDWVCKDMYEILLNNCLQYDCPIASMKYFRTTKEVDIVQETSTNIVYENEELINYYLKSMFNAQSLEQPVWNKLYKKELFTDVRFPMNQIYEDMFTVFKILSKGKKMVVSNQIGYFYYQNFQSITNAKFSKKNLDLLKVCNQIVDEVKEYDNKEIVHIANSIKENGILSLLIRIAESSDDNRLYLKLLLKELKQGKDTLQYPYIPKIQKTLIRICNFNYPLFKCVVNMTYKFYKRNI